MQLKWHPVSFVTTLGFKGGYQSHTLPLESKAVDTMNAPVSLLKPEKRSEWLCKAVGGPKANVRDTLKRSQLFDELRAKMIEGSAHLDPAAVAAEPEVDESDPMNALVSLGEEVLDGSQRTGRKRKTTRTVYTPKRASKRCQQSNH